MKFTDTFILLQLYKEIYKEYLIYDINKDINNDDAEPENEFYGVLEQLKNEIYDHIGNKKFGITTAVLCHKVGIKVKNLDNTNLDFNKLTEQDYQSECFMIDEV